MTAAAVRSSGGGGNGGPAAGGSSRPMLGARSNTKKRSCGFSVDPISLCAFSMPIYPRSVVNPRPAMSYTRTDGFFTRTPSPFDPVTRIGPEPDRMPAPSTGVNDDNAVVPDGPVNSACAHAGWITSGAFDPFSWTTSHSRVAFDTSTSKADDVAYRPATVRLYRLSG